MQINIVQAPVVDKDLLKGFVEWNSNRERHDYELYYKCEYGLYYNCEYGFLIVDMDCGS